MASAGPCASLHLAPDRQPRQHSDTQFFTGRMPSLPPNQQRQSTEGKSTEGNIYRPSTEIENRIRANYAAEPERGTHFSDGSTAYDVPSMTRQRARASCTSARYLLWRCKQASFSCRHASSDDRAAATHTRTHTVTHQHQCGCGIVTTSQLDPSDATPPTLEITGTK